MNEEQKQAIVDAAMKLYNGGGLNEFTEAMQVAQKPEFVEGQAVINIEGGYCVSWTKHRNSKSYRFPTLADLQGMFPTGLIKYLNGIGYAYIIPLPRKGQ